ncbi:prepilin-type N-terminal cleavage/methylation domain-containing protein [Planctomycetales bacterium ZRK34]|nr:prepilin-type N-terminal cleavage/methylation domain-containing protein [Planctomycetales bacterium ZRK34]
MRQRGFTLIELLVVVAIIALLIAILLPALGKARMTAKLIACAAHNREIGMASNLHLIEHRQRYPLAGQISDYSIKGSATRYLRQWDDAGGRYPLALYAALGQYMNITIRTDSRANMQTDVQDAERMAVYACPAQAEVATGLTLASSGWHAPFERTSYGFNEAVFGSEAGQLRVRGEASRIKLPSSTMLFADSKPRDDDGSGVNWVAYFNKSDDTTMLNVWQNVLAGQANQIDEERHDGMMSVTYADGHAAGIRITPTELDSVYLSKGLK